MQAALLGHGPPQRSSLCILPVNNRPGNLPCPDQLELVFPNVCWPNHLFGVLQLQHFEQEVLMPSMIPQHTPLPSLWHSSKARSSYKLPAPCEMSSP